MSKHKIALITGASSGIGKALAYEMAKKKFDVILVARNKERLEKIANDIHEKFGVSTTSYQQDLSLPGAANELHEKIVQDQFRIDVLVNNAGFGDHSPFVDANQDKLMNMIQLNIGALTELTHLLLPGMIERGYGKIMNVASVAAFMPGPLMSVYFATKAYVLHFSEALNNELQGTGVTVTTLCPGATKTEFQAAANTNESMMKGNIPTAEDVAKFGLKAMLKGKPVAIHGFKNWFMTFLVRITPRTFVPRITRSFLE